MLSHAAVGQAQPGERSIGFTSSQASAGKDAYDRHGAVCHGADLDAGSTALESPRRNLLICEA